MKPKKAQPRRTHPDLAGLEDLDAREIIDGQELEDAHVSTGDFSGAFLAFAARRTVLESVSFSGATLRSMRLRDVRLIRCDLSNAVLRTIEAARVEFIDCRLTGVKAVECRFEDVLFERCEAAYGQFRDGVARRAEFIDSRFRDADLTGMFLEESMWIRTDLTNADLTGARLNAADLRGASIEGITVHAAGVARAIVSPHQALDLARLLGLVIR